ncbi:hypothetical protein ACVWZ4_004337 [Bradyrhizobium sp. USDA 4472]
MTNVFGFSTAPSNGGDFTPIVKYDARAGRIYRLDRVESANGFESRAVEITAHFKAIIDLENGETGWISLTPGSAPDFRLVPIGNELPEKPSANHKHGVRFMLKLSKESAGGSVAIRELTGTSKAFTSGMEELYTAYKAEKAANPGKLPVVVLDHVTTVRSGSGAKSSTNFHPTFRIVGWTARGDLTFVPKAIASTSRPEASLPNGATPPSTGATRAEAPPEQDGTTGDFG